MTDIWWLEIIGFLLIASGGWRFLWRITMLLGLLGANKAGTAKGEQIKTNEKNIAEIKKGLPYALGAVVIGVALVLIF